MVIEKNSPGLGNFLIYLAIVGLIFLIGTLFGFLVFKGWQILEPPRSNLVFSTVTPTVSNLDEGTSVPHGDEIAVNLCTATPKDWTVYTVKPGDTLFDIATRTGVSLETILRGNCLTSAELLAGQFLRLPPLATPTPCLVSSPATWGVYTVQAGDVLSALATERNLSVDEIIQVNCLGSPDIFEGQKLYLPRLPTPTPCLPTVPQGWGLYTVLSGDTIFTLASARGITVEEAMRANCLSTSNIQANQQIYLPILPTPTPTLVPIPEATPIPAPVAQTLLAPPPQFDTAPLLSPPFTPPIAPQLPTKFGARNGFLMPKPGFAPGGPNEDTTPPCFEAEGPRREPWIDIITITPEKMEIGERAYFFACRFEDIDPDDDNPLSLTAEMFGPDGPVHPKVDLYPPNPELALASAQGVVSFNATCDMTPGPYTLIIKDNQGSVPATYSFKLETTDREHILTIPQAGAAGTTFQVYYCNYKTRANQEIEIDLYYAVARPEERAYDYAHATSWTVRINAYGWASEIFPSSPNDPGVAYLLQNRDEKLEGWDGIWLIR